MRVSGVMERVYDRRRLQRAWRQVRANAGAAGVDNMTVEGFAGTRRGTSRSNPRQTGSRNIPFQTCKEGPDPQAG